MAALASPTSPSSFLAAHLLLHASTSSGLQGLLCLSPSSDRRLAVSTPEEGQAAGVYGGDMTLPPLAAAHVLLRDTPVPGGGPQHNAIRPERKVTARALGQPAPAKGRGPQTNAVGQAAPRVSLAAAAADAPMQGTGPQTNAVPQWKPKGGELRLLAPQVSMVAADRPEQGDGPKINVKSRGLALRRPTPPAGPREGSGGRGGVIHAVADSTPQRPGTPAEGTGGNGGAVHDAPAAASS